jgi:RNA polymerase sigma-70 factor (ECF subfamily)
VEDDREAVARCLAGEPQHFRALVERYQTEALGHALAVLGHREDACDAVQEAFLEAYVALPRFDVSRAFYPWFYVILRNRCFKLLDRRKRRPEAAVGGSEQLLLIAGQAENVGPELEEALWSLEPADREIILLKHLDGLSYAELAERLAIPLGTVMSRLNHARRRLRERLEPVSEQTSKEVLHDDST